MCFCGASAGSVDLRVDGDDADAALPRACSASKLVTAFGTVPRGL
jgi:hypothetical protein